MTGTFMVLAAWNASSGRMRSVSPPSSLRAATATKAPLAWISRSTSGRADSRAPGGPEAALATAALSEDRRS
jgi:hypothetical protein